MESLLENRRASGAARINAYVVNICSVHVIFEHFDSTTNVENYMCYCSEEKELLPMQGPN